VRNGEEAEGFMGEREEQRARLCIRKWRRAEGVEERPRER